MNLDQHIHNEAQSHLRAQDEQGEWPEIESGDIYSNLDKPGYSNCCGIKQVGESDLCSLCLEHASFNNEEQ